MGGSLILYIAKKLSNNKVIGIVIKIIIYFVENARKMSILKVKWSESLRGQGKDDTVHLV